MSTSISYHNKDIISKAFADSFGVKSLKVYGLDLPRIVRILPTNLPAFGANELRMDNLFELEDGSLAIIDYESSYEETDKLKYADYIVRVLKQRGMRTRLRMIVIYTADIEPARVKKTYETPCMKLTIEAAFLSMLDSASIKSRLTKKVLNGERLTDEELMEFIILPLTFKGKDDKRKNVKEAIDLAKKVTDNKVSTFLISGIVVFADKVIDSDTSRLAKEWIRMTQVARAFEEEKEQAVREVETRMAAEVAKAKAEIAETKAEMAETKAEMAETKAEMAETKYRMAEMAKSLVKSVENAAKAFSLSIDEVCDKMEYSKEDYEKAKKLLSGAA